MAPKRRKQVIGDPKSFRGEFSFVNKDASNIDSKDHNAAVSWHVMNRYERWKRKEEAKKLRASVNLPSDTSRSTSAAATVSVKSDLRSEATNLLTQVKPENETRLDLYPPAPWQVDSIERTLIDPTEPSSSTGWIRSSPTPAGNTFGQSLASTTPNLTFPESFHESEFAADETQYPPIVAQILSFAYGYVVPSTWPNEMGRAKWTYEISQTWNDIVAIREDSCYASALLCFYATLMATATNDRDITSQACFFQVTALTELRQKLENQPGAPDLITLKAILKLFSAETALDNTSAARVHMKSLRNFVNLAGGVIVLEPWYRENLLAADTYFALKYETRPVFPTTEWTPGPMTSAWKARLTQTAVSEDSSSNIGAGIEHANLRAIVSDIRELFEAEHYINTHEIPADDGFLRWRQMKKYDSLNRLAEHQLGVKIYPQSYNKPKLQSAICAAIVMMTAMVLGSPEPIRSGLKILSELRTKTIEAKAELREDEDLNADVRMNFGKVLLWILHVGMLGVQTHPVVEESTWFHVELHNSAEEYGLSELQGRQDSMKAFLYSSALEREIESGRSYRSNEPRKGVYEASGTSWRVPLDLSSEEKNAEVDALSGEKGKQIER